MKNSLKIALPLLILLFAFLSSTKISAQPQSFSFHMLTPSSFAVLTANQPVLRKVANAKAAKQSGCRAYKGNMYPLVSSNAKWHNIELYNFDADKWLTAWVLKQQCKLLKVATLKECVMPPAYVVETPDGSVGCPIEGPDAQFQVRSEGIYHSLPFSVGHPSGSDNYTLQFLIAGTNPSYTYALNTSFVVSKVDDKKPSVVFDREISEGKVNYEMLYVNVPRDVVEEKVETYVQNYLTTCPDKEFAKVIDCLLGAEGKVKNVTVYFKGSDGNRYAYDYDGSQATKCANTMFTWRFVE